jgi:homoserine O-succinyltransferase
MPFRLRGNGRFRGATTILDIGIVNNMPGKALAATERQFLTLLEAAAQGIEVRLSLYALPDVPRTGAGRDHIGRFYSSIDDLWNRRLDGLIVTGMAPKAANLRDEPCWPHMAKLIEWAGRNTHSTIWSCLAAHAAVLHLDGIERRRLAEKRFGLFECDRVSEHRLTSGMPSRLVIPHSRWNDLPEEGLVRSGYRVLTRGDAAGADLFVKQRQSLFVFFQGHPEYDADTLLLEYLRDVGQYLRRESESYPPMPRRYLDRDTAQALAALQQRALSERRNDLLPDDLLPDDLLQDDLLQDHLLRDDLVRDLRAALHPSNLANIWRSPATRIYCNWLRYLTARKQPQMSLPLGRPRETTLHS